MKHYGGIFTDEARKDVAEKFRITEAQAQETYAWAYGAQAPLALGPAGMPRRECGPPAAGSDSALGSAFNTNGQSNTTDGAAATTEAAQEAREARGLAREVAEEGTSANATGAHAAGGLLTVVFTEPG